MVDTSTIPRRKGKTEQVHKNGSTQDIIDTILLMDSETGDEMKDFSRQFNDGEAGLRRLFVFVRDRIKYKIDGFGVQDIKTPAALWDIGHGDCKSKTIFVNSVLKCLGIKYIIRFTRYDNNGKDMRHVYTVAKYKGKEIPLDTVYKQYGKQKKWTYKKDYKPMTRINKISGFEKPVPQTAAGVVPAKVMDINKYLSAPKGAIYVGGNQSCKRQEEIKQKQRYIPQAEKIPFNKVSEGVASLMIAKRQLVILKWMKPELKAVCQKGIDLVDKVIKNNDYSITGDIPKELYNLCVSIQTASKNGMPANSHGLKAKKIEQLRAKRESHTGDRVKCEYVGAFPERKYFNSLWFADWSGTPYNYGTLVNPDNTQNGFWNYNLGTWASSSATVGDIFSIPPSSQTAAQQEEIRDSIYLWYGRNSDYRVTLKDEWTKFRNNMFALGCVSTSGYTCANPPLKNPNYSNMSGEVSNTLDYDLILETISQSSDVLSNFLNDTYKDNPNGSMGSGLMYSFKDTVTLNGSSISPNSFPATVIAKAVNQSAFIDSTKAFTGASYANIQGMARNNVLYDNGEQPEITMEDLLKLHYLNDTSQIGIICGGACIAGIVAAIATLISGIVAAIPSIIDATNGADTQANLIDSVLQDTARYGALQNSNMPGADDWAPMQRRNGGGAGSNNGLLLGAAGLLGVAALLNKDKKKK